VLAKGRDFEELAEVQQLGKNTLAFKLSGRGRSQDS
jgi:hypothetical protein